MFAFEDLFMRVHKCSNENEWARVLRAIRLPVNSLLGPLLTRMEAFCPTFLYALRRGTFSREISASTTTDRSPGVTCRLRTKVAGFQSGASSAMKRATYHWSLSLYCFKSCKGTKTKCWSNAELLDWYRI